MSGVHDRVALVTGAGSGIGAAVAGRLAAGGARVAVLDLDNAAADQVASGITARGNRALAVAADVRKADEVAAAVSRVAAEFGTVHILVNNAGILRDRMLFKMPEADWDAVMDVHLKGAFLCSKAAQRHMVEAGFGRIINMSSTSALGNRGQANYSAAKAGLQGFTRTLALELGAFGVTVNAIAPGFVETAMTHAVADRTGTEFGSMRERMAAAVPTRRTGVPADIANAAAFFAAEESSFVTGQVLYVDGGLSLP
ncbi:MAG TPA: 3-oxoacyl-ACP reductase FabG [Trebonia sp.]|jgi:3-oxoacyl-[acyl-carrier protein] reductase